MMIKQSEIAQNKVCLCGCGKELRDCGRSGYSQGHYLRTDEHKLLLSAKKKGHKGTPHTDEWKENARNRSTGEKNPRFGVSWSDEEREAIGARGRGKKKSDHMRQKLSETKKGKLPYPNAIEVLSKYNQCGENHSCWKGGLSFEPYPPAFNIEFKRRIRERDGNQCVVCGGFGNQVHHLNYIKDDTVPENCITLCRKCHGKTNQNREYWIKYFCAYIAHTLADVERTVKAAEELAITRPKILVV